jgi:hypothetical protein
MGTVAKYLPCRVCGKKPKAYLADKKEPKEYLIDHWCKEERGKLFIGSFAGLKDLIKFWNQNQVKE